MRDQPGQPGGTREYVLNNFVAIFLEESPKRAVVWVADLFSPSGVDRLAFPSDQAAPGDVFVLMIVLEDP